MRPLVETLRRSSLRPSNGVHPCVSRHSDSESDPHLIRDTLENEFKPVAGNDVAGTPSPNQVQLLPAQLEKGVRPESTRMEATSNSVKYKYD